MYIILLWICGKKVPGRLKKQGYSQGKDFNKSKAGIILAYYFILVVLILVSILAIKYIVRGEL